MQNFLTAKGFNVLTARDGAKAVQMHRRFKEEIAVVILDLGLALFVVGRHAIDSIGTEPGNGAVPVLPSHGGKMLCFAGDA